MNAKLKTRDIEKALYMNFFKRALECLNASKTSFSKQEWNASTINAIHSCIAACDSICVYFLGKRSAGDKHGDAVKLFKMIKNSKEIDANASRISRILSIKNMAEYEERLVFKSESEKILKDCERLFDYVKQQLPQK